MGLAKSIAHSYTYNEYLYFYINKNDTGKVEEILQLRPNLIRDPLTAHTKTTALNRTCYNGNIQLAQLLIQKYQADVNLASVKGQTPLISAVKRNHVQMVKFLLKNGANANYVDTSGFRTIDYAILQGLYEIAHLLYCELKEKQLNSPMQYQEIGKQFSYRYVDYQTFLTDLKAMVEPDNVKQFLEKKRNILSDPVIDPRQTWKQWFWRNLDFKDPPLVERTQLPEDLRPENRRFGRINHILGRLTLSPISQVPSYKNPTQSEGGQAMTKNQINKINSQNVELQTVS